MTLQSYPLTSFTCGHIGRDNAEPKRGQKRAFIRVAEVRNSRVDESDEECPDCKVSR